MYIYICISLNPYRTVKATRRSGSRGGVSAAKLMSRISTVERCSVPREPSMVESRVRIVDSYVT